MARPLQLVLQASAYTGLDTARTPEEVKQCIEKNFEALGTFNQQPCGSTVAWSSQADGLCKCVSYQGCNEWTYASSCLLGFMCLHQHLVFCHVCFNKAHEYITRMMVMH